MSPMTTKDRLRLRPVERCRQRCHGSEDHACAGMTDKNEGTVHRLEGGRQVRGQQRRERESAGLWALCAGYGGRAWPRNRADSPAAPSRRTGRPPLNWPTATACHNSMGE
jgi:hypothetical protein